MKITNLFYYIAFLFAVNAAAQHADSYKMPEVIPPSPTVANLMNFEEVPIDYYTGQPDINLPLFSKKIGNDLTLPIVLKYNTQGVKLTQRSGWTGTG